MAPILTSTESAQFINLLSAFLVGTGFGFALEQGGFSSSRKLAGMFYGYDTTVLKVFFTAAITAMLGMLFFSLFGWMDLGLIYINPTYLYSAIAGGVVMGVGFILGGFCPGTAFCALSIGKLDALAFVGGLVLGIFFFTEGYPLWEELYKAEFIGAPTMNDLLDIPRGVFALLLILIAFAMFFVAEWSEKKFPREEY